MDSLRIADEWAHARLFGDRENIWFSPSEKERAHVHHWRIHLGVLTIDLWADEGSPRVWFVDAAPFARGMRVAPRLRPGEAQIAALAIVQRLLHQHIVLMDGQF